MYEKAVNGESLQNKKMFIEVLEIKHLYTFASWQKTHSKILYEFCQEI